LKLPSEINAPKEQHKSAWGIAPGRPAKLRQALEGRHSDVSPFHGWGDFFNTLTQGVALDWRVTGRWPSALIRALCVSALKRGIAVTLPALALLTISSASAQDLGDTWGTGEREAAYYRIVNVPLPEGVYLEAGSFVSLPDGSALGAGRF
jgi:hypothetical protein